MAMLGAGLALPIGATDAAVPARKHLRIDVHHHFVPDEVVGNRYIVPPLKSWSLQKSLEDMEQGGVTTAMLSVTPQVLTALAQGGEATSAHYRRANDFAAKLVADHPSRYGLFAGIPITEPDAALKEIDYAFSNLKAEGIGFIGVPKGIRTRVTAVKGRCPRPLDDGDSGEGSNRRRAINQAVRGHVRAFPRPHSASRGISAVASVSMLRN
jgi:hypothetical protein